MKNLTPGFVDIYVQGRIFEVEEQDPQATAEYLSNLIREYEQAGDDDALCELRTRYSIRDVGLEVEAGTNNLRNPLWLKVDTSRRLVGATGKEVAPHVADLIRNAGVVGDGRTGNPIAVCVPCLRTGDRQVWHIDPREIAVLSRRQIEDQLVAWV